MNGARSSKQKSVGAPISTAVTKLNWIAKLSKNNCPPGIPHDPQAVATLLNRIVTDVRTACSLLSDLSDLSDRSDQSDLSDSRAKPPSPSPNQPNPDLVHISPPLLRRLLTHSSKRRMRRKKRYLMPPTQSCAQNMILQS